MEINPRFPGTMALTVAAGANIPVLVLALQEGRPVECPSWTETAIDRTFAETIVDPGLFDAGRQEVA